MLPNNDNRARTPGTGLFQSKFNAPVVPAKPAVEPRTVVSSVPAGFQNRVVAPATSGGVGLPSAGLSSPVQDTNAARTFATPILQQQFAGIPTQQQMSATTFSQMRDVIYRLSGIYFTETKKYLLEGRISKRMAHNKIATFEEYLTFISNPVTSRMELPALYEAITINETYFFRSEQQMDALEQILIPSILQGNSAKSTFKIWSAASSTGEEAYTMAMIISERIKPKFPHVNFQIVGTDINNAVLDSARRGVYRDYAVRNVPSAYMQKYFRKDGDVYILSDQIKRMVSFNYLNLYDTNSMRQMQNFDVIFCCNVLIYFDLASKQQVVSSLYDSLNKNSFLFIGYSESLHGISKAFELVHLPKALAYKKV